MQRRLLLPLGILFFTAATHAASAAPVLYAFTGVVADSSVGGIAVGDPIVGTFVYDPDAPVFSAIPTFFHFSPTLATISATVGGSPLVSAIADEWVGDDFFLAGFPEIPLDTYDEFAVIGTPLSLGFLDADASFFDAFVTLPTVLPLGEFEYVLITISLAGGSASGLVTVVPAAVPEPASLFMFGVGAAAAVSRRRSR